MDILKIILRNKVDDTHDDVMTNHAGGLIIISFSTIADWSIRHCEVLRVSSTLLRTVEKNVWFGS